MPCDGFPFQVEVKRDGVGQPLGRRLDDTHGQEVRDVGDEGQSRRRSIFLR